MCTWSDIKCPSIISTPLYWHNLIIISLISFLSWLYITFRLYFGVKTMWYLHIHFVCANEFVFVPYLIKTTPKRRGFLWGYKPMLLARVSRRCFLFVQAIAFDSRHPSKGFISSFLLLLSSSLFFVFFLHFFIFKWILIFFYTQFIHCYIMCLLFPYIFCDCLII